jgi:hypothetical protein
LHAIRDTGAVSDVRESAVAVIAVENVLYFTRSIRLWRLRVADQIDIQEAIAVIINEAAAATHGLDQILCARSECFEVPLDTRGSSDVDELNWN